MVLEMQFWKRLIGLIIQIVGINNILIIWYGIAPFLNRGSSYAMADLGTGVFSFWSNVGITHPNDGFRSVLVEK